MTLAETIYQHRLHLPESAAQQVLAFIQTLEKSDRVRSSAPEAIDDTEAFLAAVAGTLGDDFPDEITDDDFCKTGDLRLPTDSVTLDESWSLA